MISAHDRDVYHIDEIVLVDFCQPKDFLRLHVAQVITSTDVALVVHVHTDTSFDVLEIDTVRELLKILEEQSAGLLDNT